ncbi:MAG: sodium:solute symporter [Pseudomonadota bacterium]
MPSIVTLLKIISLGSLLSVLNPASPEAMAQAEENNFIQLNDTETLPRSAATVLESAACDKIHFQNLDLSGSVVCWGGNEGWLSHQDGSGETELRALPALPDRASALHTILDSDLIFVVTRTHILNLNISTPTYNWTTIFDLPSGFEMDGPVVALNGKLYLFSTVESLVVDVRLKTSETIAASPVFPGAPLAFSSGDAHIFVVSPQENSDTVQGYHIITDSWFVGPEIELPTDTRTIVAKGTSFTAVSNTASITGQAVLKPLPFGLLDTLAIVLVVIALLAIGVFQSRGSSSSKDYFRGGGTIPWWAAGLSLFATLSSAISLMSMPAMAFSGDWIYFSLGVFSIIIMLPLFIFVFVPVIRRLNMPTANAYLEERFGLSVRLLGFVSFSMNQILGRVAAILLLPAIAINSIFGIPITLSILLTGLCTTAFVTFGGLKAVIWTDVLLALVMILAVSTALIFIIFMIDFSIAESWAILEEKDKLRMFDFRLDWAAPVALVLFLNTFATSLGFISDQNFVQRVQSTKSESTAKRASITQVLIAVPLNVLLFALGSLLFLYFTTQPETISPAMKMDGILPYFSAIALPPGLGGFVVAALLAATVSTISSALNSVSNLGVEDIYRRFNPRASEQQCMNLARGLTVALGLAGTGLAVMLASLSGMQSIWNLFLMVTGLIIGPVTGIYILGIFTKRANETGVWIGFGSAVVANAYATFFLNLHATVFLVISFTVTVVVGYLASYLTQQSSLKSEGLTIYTLPEAERSMG